MWSPFCWVWWVKSAATCRRWVKMFIAAGTDFSGGKVWDVVKSKGQKRKPPPEWAAALCDNV